MNGPTPSIATCLELIERYEMLDNIRQHSFVVARVARTLVENLIPERINSSDRPPLDLVLAGALLHDIAKTECLDGSCLHADRGREICETHGYPEVGMIVGDHVILSSFHPEEYRRGLFPAREIVYYADKRVKHENIVSLPERLEYIIDRYSDGSEQVNRRIKENFNICRKLEDYLFGFLPFSPDELAKHVCSMSFEPAESSTPSA